MRESRIVTQGTKLGRDQSLFASSLTLPRNVQYTMAVYMSTNGIPMAALINPSRRVVALDAAGSIVRLRVGSLLAGRTSGKSRWDMRAARPAH